MPGLIKIVAVEAGSLAVTGLRDFRISEEATRTDHSVLLRLRATEPGLEVAETVSAPPGKPQEFAEEIVGAVQRFAAPALLGVAIEELSLANARVAAALKGRVRTKAGIRDQGYRTIKIKVGETVPSDLARLQAVREAVGSDVALCVDANDQYRAGDAIRFIRAIERFAPEHVEQPVPRGDLLGLAAVQAAVGMPLLTDARAVVGAGIRREMLVGVAGFEPATPASRTLCSTRLSYTPIAGRCYRARSALRASPAWRSIGTPGAEIEQVEHGLLGARIGEDARGSGAARCA